MASAIHRYSTVAIILHWLIALLLILEIGLGLRMESLRGPDKFAVFQLHKSIGITILMLVAIRLAWRALHRPPPIVAKRWETGLAHVVHILFYVLLFAMPISGWVIVSTSRIEVPTLLYGLVPWPHLPLGGAAKQVWHDVSEGIHVNLVNLIYLLFAFHVAGALKHHLIDRDGTIAKMAPGVKPGAWADPRLIAIALGVLLMAGIGLTRGTVQPPQPRVAAPAPVPVAEPIVPAAPEKAEPEAKPGAETASGTVPEATQPLSRWAISSASTLRFTTRWGENAIEGGFRRFDGDILFSPDKLDQSRVTITIHTGSIFSGDAQRDGTLQSEDWFAVGSHATAVFRADRFRKTGEDRYVADGTLKLKTATLPVALPFTLQIDGDRATMRGTATIDRTAFSIGDSSTSEIPAEVKVDVSLTARRKP